MFMHRGPHHWGCKRLGIGFPWGPRGRHFPIPRRILEIIILKMLSEKPMHGYEIKKKLDELAEGCWKVSFSRIYPLMRRMVHHGLVKREATEKGGKTLLTYTLTEKGREVLNELLGEIGEFLLFLTERVKRDPFAAFRLLPLFSPLGLSIVKMLPDDMQREILKTFKDALMNLLRYIEERLKETEK